MEHIAKGPFQVFASQGHEAGQQFEYGGGEQAVQQKDENQTNDDVQHELGIYFAEKYCIFGL
jgi:hypothetical protein